jgi:hypothetical protein
MQEAVSDALSVIESRLAAELRCYALLRSPADLANGG